MPNGRWSRTSIIGRVSIHDRPAEVQSRIRSGDWEADLMSFSKPGQFLLVAQERRSRRALSLRQKARTAQSVADNLSVLVEAMPAGACQSITFDNGAEFSKHYLLSQRFGIRTWFCDTHSPWQKGGIENLLAVYAATCPGTLISTPCHPTTSAAAWSATTTLLENAWASKLLTRYSGITLLHFKREFIDVVGRLVPGDVFGLAALLQQPPP